MSPFPANPVHHSPSEAVNDNAEIDLLAGLWLEAPFARLPHDAPPELHEYVVDIDDPRRVYAIHRASRRHDFQSLVERYIFQLRNGCGVSNCMIPTCFTCRKRLAGKAPIRRYNLSSARTLAIYLAGRDDPDDGLCLALRQTKEASRPSLNNLIFETNPHQVLFPPKPKRSSSRGSSASSKMKARPESRPVHGSKPQVRDSGNKPLPPKRSASVTDRDNMPGQESQAKEKKSSDMKYTIRDTAASKDHRSFTANVFGTVAFRMLEWLTPQGHDAMAERWKSQNTTFFPNFERVSKASSTTTPQTDLDAEIEGVPKAVTVLSGEPPENLPPATASSKDPSKSRRSSEATFRTTQAPRPNRRKSLDPPPTHTSIEEPRSPRSPRINNFHGEKPAPPLKSSSTALPRSVIDISKVFESVPPPNTQLSYVEDETSTQSMPDNSIETSISHSQDAEITLESDKQGEQLPSDEAMVAEVDYPLPQSLSRLNTEIVEFICNIFDEDCTSESPFDDEFEATEASQQPWRANKSLMRRVQDSGQVSRKQWKAFNEQTLFHVLSNPHSLVSSFTDDGKLFDSQMLYYCMQRLTKTKPSLVFHSLWMAAESLFIPPKGLRGLKAHKQRVSGTSQFSLSSSERASVISICLHALVGSIPVPPESNFMDDMSLIRSQGLTLSYYRHALNHPSWLLERFDDAFSSDLAIRLARRLCCAITAHHQFTKMLNIQGVDRVDPNYSDIMKPTINHIVASERTVASKLSDFDLKEQAVHGERVQSLILDWARTVLFHDWNGEPVFPTNGPFAGALSLIEAMHKHRDILLLSDAKYTTDYFSDRLDAIDVPIAWLDFTTTRHERHLLDYPYVFSSDRLVSFFRSINFSRMSRTFEESSSLKTRMKAILERGSLITNPHHKTVLQDWLKTASAKYLVLEIGRDNVLRDAFNQLWRREERELLRPLKVHLGEEGGEEGFDSGGVQQEFFRLAIAECLDPNYGAFTIDDRTRMAWFSPGSVVETWKFELMGLLVSLAVFNGLTLPVTFPKALYRKLLGWPVEGLRHIEDGWPSLASGLTSLLEWNERDGSVEDIFARTYEFSVLTYGSHVTKQMTAKDSSWPQMSKSAPTMEDSGEEPPLVTADNRETYVKDYIRYLTNVSIEPQYAAFERGFRACLVPKSLTLLDPTTLQALVEGVQEIDISELRRYTRYVGWDASHYTVKDFWSIVKRYDENMKRRLLEFVTASDRLPVGGMQNLQFVVQKNGEEEGEGGHLPTAYTCYGTLLLPEYKDKEVLKERLSMALENAQGFGFA